jgi:hypothetical protein
MLVMFSVYGQVVIEQFDENLFAKEFLFHYCPPF